MKGKPDISNLNVKNNKSLSFLQTHSRSMGKKMVRTNRRFSKINDAEDDLDMFDFAINDDYNYMG